MKNKIFTVLLMAVVLCLASCEDKSGVSKKNVKVTDFMELYGKTTEEVDAALTNFVLDKCNYDDDGNLYWVVTKKKNQVQMTLDGDDVFVSITFANGICIQPSLLYSNTASNGLSLATLKEKYGNGNELGKNWYKWSLTDGSVITYFGNTLSSGRRTLIIYREAKESSNAPQKVMRRVIENVGLE